MLNLAADLSPRPPARTLVQTGWRVWYLTWSRDGESVIYSVEAGGPALQYLWRVDADGARPPERIEVAGVQAHAPTVARHRERLPRRLTQDHGDDNVPTWSADGRRVYFSSSRSGSREIWSVPAEGGQAEQVTRGGASFIGLESSDRTALFFSRPAANRAALVALSLEKGTERTLLDCMAGVNAFALSLDALYYVDCSPDAPALHRLDPDTGHDEVLGSLDGYAGYLIAVSPDGRSILYPKIVDEGSDIMLIENFR